MPMLTRYLTPILAGLCLTAGACQPEPLAEPALAFCDAAEPRRFTQAELDARAAFPVNLRKDFKDNKTGERECGWFQ